MVQSKKEFKNSWYWVETLPDRGLKLRFTSPQVCPSKDCRTFHYSFTKPNITETGYEGFCPNCEKFMIIPFRKEDAVAVINYEEILYIKRYQV